MRIDFKTEGFAELERALAEDLPKAVAKGALRRAAIAAMEPLREQMGALAPKETGQLARSMRTQPVKAQRAKGSVRFERQSGVQVQTGPAPASLIDRANAGFQEFGTVEMTANPYARPAAIEKAKAVIASVKIELTAQIAAAKQRIAKKLAKGAKSG